MGQGTETWRNERNLERERTVERKANESATGRDMPDGDGNVGDEQVDALGKPRRGKPTGQDHSNEHHESTDADHGVEAIQDREDRTSDTARISDQS